MSNAACVRRGVLSSQAGLMSRWMWGFGPQLAARRLRIEDAPKNFHMRLRAMGPRAARGMMLALSFSVLQRFAGML